MKRKIRNRVLQKRRSLSAQWIAAKSRAIARHLFELPEFQLAGTVMFYVSRGSEVDTHQMIRDALRTGKRVAVPVTVPEGRKLIPVLIRDLDRELALSPQGTLEPVPESKRALDPSEIDLVILPGVAFDPRGNRLGRGRAYYDNFLREVRASVGKVALAFERQIVENIPPASHDVPVNKVVTEERVIDCARFAGSGCNQT